MFTRAGIAPHARRLAATAIHHAWSRVCRLGAITPDHDGGRRFGGLGRGSCIAFPPGAIFGEEWIQIGEDTLIGPHVTLSAGMAPGQQMVSNPVVRLGDRCMIGRGSHIVGHLSIDIGDDVWTGPYVYVTDQNHSYADVSIPIGRQWPVDSTVRIGSGSWLGAGVAVLPGATIGDHVVVAAGSVVRGNVPDRCVVAGSPARIVRWYDDNGDRWVTERQVGGPRVDPDPSASARPGRPGGPPSRAPSPAPSPALSKASQETPFYASRENEATRGAHAGADGSEQEEQPDRV